MEKIRKKLYRRVMGVNYQESDQRSDDRLLLGQTLLEGKRNLWNSGMEFALETFDEFGFRVFSQSNEDGLIQYLIRRVKIPNKTFIEFGVEDYTECNTKFLLLNNNWSGLIMDGSRENMDKLIKSSFYWCHDVSAVGAFITKENINDLIRGRGFDREVGILSIDIDGNDYWIWDKIDCIDPAIVICEYNAIYGGEACVTIPYEENFYRTQAHYSNLYWGASLNAFVQLGKKKGYRLVCVNQMGHNAFFVRNDLAGGLKEITAKEAYRGLTYRESRDADGNLTYLSQKEGQQLIGDQ